MNEHQETTEPPTVQAKPRISRMTVGRLHNLGNYEHIRYEISVELPEGVNPAKTLAEVETILNNLEPKQPWSDYELRAAKELLSKPSGELEDWEVANLPSARLKIEECEKHAQKRNDARKALNQLGGTSVLTDDKDNWNE